MKIQILLFAIMVTVLAGCTKYLEAKPDLSLAVPDTAKDLQALLDNTYVMNARYPFSTELSADNYFLDQSSWESLDPTTKNMYVWEKDLFNDNINNDWSFPYTIVYYANVVLDQIKSETFQTEPASIIQDLEGQALFFRSLAFFNLLQVFANPWDPASANAAPGIALRLDPDLNKPTTRATLKSSYEQVIQDTKLAAAHLKTIVAVKTRPSKAAAYGLLSRIYAAMADYPNSGLFADSALSLQHTLIDFNALDSTSFNPINRFNDEVIFHSIFVGTRVLSYYAKADTNLIASFSYDDLRRPMFFELNPSDNSWIFKGSYDGSILMFNGLAVDEMLLNRAEAAARAGQIAAAMDDLNELMATRFRQGQFIPYVAADKEEALNIILGERRKELCFRGIRWSDLRRLNKEPDHALTLKRILGSQTFTLEPGSPRYTLPIPKLVIQQTGIEQNP